MGDLIFEKNSEDGYLLLETLTTLGVITSIIFIIFPIVVNWMMIRNDSKNEVEMHRVFYEESIEWNEKTPQNRKYNNTYQIESDVNTLRVSTDNQAIEVKVYEYEFQE